MFVLTGTLAGYGIGLGAFGAVLSVARPGIVATRRRHVAGKTDALFGVLIWGLGRGRGRGARDDRPVRLADHRRGDWVQRFREWLD